MEQATHSDIPPRPKTINNFDGEPPAALVPLCFAPNWVGWRWEWNGKKNTKPPYRVDAPEIHASSTDSATWGTLKTAMAAVKAGAIEGIGFALHGTQYGAIDLDRCREPDSGKLTAWAQRPAVGRSRPR